ncbi:MAG: right-handed parallel beta-helix repeat-containing protein [Deltaproteobacteria bacterium]|nr:right-handed parallel beta-helix repeat-containing protein [Deltaproteobacteria bacterium]
MPRSLLPLYAFLSLAAACGTARYPADGSLADGPPIEDSDFLSDSMERDGDLDLDDPDADLPGDGPQQDWRYDAPLETSAYDFTPQMSCRALPLPCLPTSTPDLVEVTGSTEMEAAFNKATAGQTIQVKGLALGDGWIIPPYVTLRGCASASIERLIRFEGSGGAIEGFTVSGYIVANKTGTYAIRANHFVAGSTEPAFAVTAQDANMPVTITAVVDGNIFSKRQHGIRVRTDWDTGTRDLNVTIKNNIFTGVDSAITVSESGAAGHISVFIEHNTIYGFDRGVIFEHLQTPPALRATVFMEGNEGIRSNGPYDVLDSLTWKVMTPAVTPARQGVLAIGAPQFVDAANDDFRFPPSSPLVDKVAPTARVPDTDYYGCSRPVAISGAEARADIGAIELQH